MMVVIGFIVTFVVCGIIMIGGLAIDKAWRRYFFRTVVAVWQREGAIQWGPKFVSSYGLKPKAVHGGSVFGLVGIVDRHLKFVGHFSIRDDTAIPLEQIRGLALCSITVQSGKTTVQKKALEVHAERGGEWCVYIFVPDVPMYMRTHIQQFLDKPVPERDTSKQVIPVHAHLMEQDVYGEWHEGLHDDLYLAPDRVVFGWRGVLHFSQIRRIAVLERGGLSSLNPFAQDLVRIESVNDDGQFQVIGFLMRGAERWAESLAQTVNLPVETQIGRKKKENG